MRTIPSICGDTANVFSSIPFLRPCPLLIIFIIASCADSSWKYTACCRVGCHVHTMCACMIPHSICLRILVLSHRGPTTQPHHIDFLIPFFTGLTLCTTLLSNKMSNPFSLGNVIALFLGCRKIKLYLSSFILII